MPPSFPIRKAALRAITCNTSFRVESMLIWSSFATGSGSLLVFFASLNALMYFIFSRCGIVVDFMMAPVAAAASVDKLGSSAGSIASARGKIVVETGIFSLPSSPPFLCPRMNAQFVIASACSFSSQSTNSRSEYSSPIFGTTSLSHTVCGLGYAAYFSFKKYSSLIFPLPSSRNASFGSPAGSGFSTVSPEVILFGGSASKEM
mmetsp:Transcript_22467/g.56780  ORF Transcript_22467/g.56780 Transcript_22467/m.56780 type:complete len:204 (-) Transcript_22467:981-1592(-)